MSTRGKVIDHLARIEHFMAICLRSAAPGSDESECFRKAESEFIACIKSTCEQHGTKLLEGKQSTTLLLKVIDRCRIILNEGDWR